MSDDFSFDGIEANTFADVPAGTYVAIVESTEVGKASTGTTSLRVQFRIVQGEQKNRVISDWLYFTSAAAGVVLAKITAAGIQPPTGVTGSEGIAAKIGHLLVPRHVDIVVREETYQGETRTKVKAWKTSTLQTAGVGASTSSSDDGLDIPFG